MIPGRLILRDGALRDLARHERHLAALRGPGFAEAWSETLLVWLENRAPLGVQFETAHPKHPGYRTFGCRRHATILVEFTKGAMDVFRIRFAGEDWQDWSSRHRSLRSRKEPSRSPRNPLSTQVSFK